MIIRHLILRVPKKDHNFDNHPYVGWGIPYPKPYNMWKNPRSQDQMKLVDVGLVSLGLIRSCHADASKY